MVGIVEIPQIIEYILENSTLFAGPHNSTQERTSSGLTPLDPLRQLDLIWKGICVYLSEALHEGRGVNIKHFGAFSFEPSDTSSSLSLQPRFIPSKELESMIVARKSQLDVTVEGSIYQQGLRMSYLNPAPIAAGCYFQTDFVRSAIDTIFRAINDLVFRGYNIRIVVPSLLELRVVGRKLSCTFDATFRTHSQEIASSWPRKSINSAISVFDIPKLVPNGDEIISPVHLFKSRKPETKLNKLQKPDASSLKNIKERIKGLDDSSRDLFNIVPTDLMAIAAARRASKKNVPQRLSIMEKKIPTNPKFAHIKSVINTGSSASNLPKPLTDQELAKRRTEMFKRIKCSRVYEMIQNMEGADDTESVYDIVAPDMTEKLDAKSIVSISQQSTGSRVSTVESGAIGLANSRDILLIDLRPADEFRKSRIPFAVNHPGHLITRDCFSPGMKNFMVKVKGRAIVVYHTDDKQSAYYATLLIQKGWEEVWIVEGGFSEFMHSYPEGVDESS